MSLTQLIERANKSWHGVHLNQPDWGPNSHSIAFSAELRDENLVFHLISNGYWDSLDFELPKLGSGSSRRSIDTALDTPQDIVLWEAATAITGDSYQAAARSVVMLYATKEIECPPVE